MPARRYLVPAAASLALFAGACERTATDANEAAMGEASGGTLAEALDDTDGLSTTHELVGAADLDTVLAGTGPYTLFAPSNAALSALPDDVVAALRTAQAKPQLTSLLSGHIVPGAITPADLAAAVDGDGGSAELRTMAGDMLTLARAGNGWTLTAPGGEAVRIGGAPARAANGMLYTVDGVLMRD